MIKLCHINDITEGSARGFDLHGEKYFAVKRDTQLEWHEDGFLDSDGELIQCATHGALFVIETGECVSGPCLGDRLSPAKISLENGEVLIDADL